MENYFLPAGIFRGRHVVQFAGVDVAVIDGLDFVTDIDFSFLAVRIGNGVNVGGSDQLNEGFTGFECDFLAVEVHVDGAVARGLAAPAAADMVAADVDVAHATAGQLNDRAGSNAVVVVGFAVLHDHVVGDDRLVGITVDHLFAVVIAVIGTGFEVVDVARLVIVRVGERHFHSAFIALLVIGFGELEGVAGGLVGRAVVVRGPFFLDELFEVHPCVVRGNALARTGQNAVIALDAVEKELRVDAVILEVIVDARAGRILSAPEDKGSVPFLADLAVMQTSGTDCADEIGMVVVIDRGVAGMTRPPQQRLVDDIRLRHVPVRARLRGVADLHHAGRGIRLPSRGRWWGTCLRALRSRRTRRWYRRRAWSAHYDRGGNGGCAQQQRHSQDCRKNAQEF